MRNLLGEVWGDLDLGAVKPLAVHRWFLTLPLAQKTKAHIKSVMRQVFEYAMLCELFEMQRNPMDLIRIEGGTLTNKDPLILDARAVRRIVAADRHRALPHDDVGCNVSRASPLRDFRPEVV
ncbi:MAG: hypothetical protein WAM65_04520 [Candidatus Korobacteraceae bacterium]